MKTLSYIKPILELLSLYDTTSSYIHYIAVSSDSLAIINNNGELIEWIINGNDPSAVVIAVDDENSFLDAISTFKKIILSGENPLMYL